MMLQSQILKTLQDRLTRDRLPVSIKLWNGQVVTGVQPPLVTVSINSASALTLLVNPSLGKFAESYVHGKIDLSGNANDIIRVLMPLIGSAAGPKKKLIPGWNIWRHTRKRDRDAIKAHYDVSNDFYALWLDKQRIYSCAYFKAAEDGLDLAQEQKLEHICRKLNLQENEAVLDIGCGWGGLMIWAAEHYKTHCTGITLSQNQHDYVRQQIRERGLEDRCEVHLMDYRDVDESKLFDKIVSVGMFEHVGIRKLPTYFRKIYSLLKPGGIVMNHGITSAIFDDEAYGDSGVEFIQRYVFPDGELTHISKVIEIMSRQGLECRDVEGLRSHYAKTLWHWVNNLDAHQEEARNLVGERVYRTWRAYMAGFAYAFESGRDSIFQILAAKPLADGSVSYPLTREHVYR